MAMAMSNAAAAAAAFGTRSGAVLLVGLHPPASNVMLVKKHKRNAELCRAGLQEIAPATAAAYGLTLLGGGLAAYARTGSKGSLVGGCTGGVSLALAYFLMLNPETKDVANAIAFGAAFLFIAVFGIRLASTRKALPAGLLMAISIAASVVFVNAYFDARLP